MTAQKLISRVAVGDCVLSELEVLYLWRKLAPWDERENDMLM